MSAEFSIVEQQGTQRKKTTICKVVLESISIYGCDVWKLSKRNRSYLKAMEMDFWRRSSGILKTHVTNYEGGE